MSERRPHWDDDLIDAVFRALSHTYRAQGWTGGIAIDLDESVYPLIAAVEDWHEKFVMHGAFRVLAERAASAEADRDRLANQLLNEVPDSYIQMKARALDAEAAIQRVREVVEHDGYTVTLPTANWNTQLESMDDPYRAEVVLSADILEALEAPNE